MEPREKELAELARKLGFTSDPQPEQESVLQTISNTIRRGVQKVFECAKCARKFRITNARENGIYKCASCNLVMTEAHDTTVEIVKGEKVELVLDETIPQDVQKAIADPANVFGRYVLVEMIGEGAMGSVHRAYDVELSRYVALKFIKSERAEELKAEAKTLASLEHKNIARIYDIGSVRGKGFIAMQLINGVSLKWIEGDEAKAIDIVMTVAEAVEYAHKRGVVHRDLKPENIMLDTEGGVFVMDFGLATSRPDAGDIAGTPGYMAPEIAAGKSATAKSDVFSLGCTLYYMIAGRIPFELAGATDLGRVLDRIRSGKTIPIRNVYPAIDRELEAIINKATAAEPERRYPTAAEFAQDIRRFKMGYPVGAFSTSTTYRAKKAILRNRVLAGVVMGALIVISIVGVLLFQKWKEKNLEESRTKTLIQEFLDDMAAAHTEALENRMAGYTYEQLCRIPGRVERKYRKISDMGVRDHRVHYSLGRLYRIVGDENRALEEQRNALAIKPDYPEAHYEAGILLFHLYRSKMDDLRRKALARISEELFTRLKGEAVSMRWKNPSDSEIENEPTRKMREECLGHFLECEQTDIAKGIRALMAGEISAAMNFFSDMRGYNEDAVFFIVELLCRNTPVPVDVAEKAIGKLNEAVTIDRGNIGFMLKRGSLNTSLAYTIFYSRGEISPHFKLAADDFEAVLKLHPNNRNALSWLGALLSGQGLFESSVGLDAAATYMRAISILEGAIVQFKEDADILLSLGLSKINFGNFKCDHGADGSALFLQAITHLSRSLELDPADFQVWVRRGLAYEDYANFLKDGGKDPNEMYRKATDDYDKSISINRGHYEAWMRRGTVRCAMANYMSTHGEDPTRNYSGSVSDLEQALRLNREFYKIHLAIGTTKSNWAVYQRNSGNDAAPICQEAIDAFTSAINLNPGDYEPLMSRGFALMNLAHAQERIGKDTTPLYRNALRDIDAALAIKPNDDEALLARGNVFSSFGTHQNDSGDDPSAAYTNALQSYEEAAAVNPRRYEIYDNMGNVRGNWGNYLKRNGGDPVEQYTKALEHFEKSIGINVSNLESWSGKGMIHVNWGAYIIGLGKDPTQMYLDAVKDYSEAIKINDKQAELWKNRGGAFVNLGNYKYNNGADPTEETRNAWRDLTEASKLDPGDWQIYYFRGGAVYNFALYLDSIKKPCSAEADEALADFRKAVQLKPAIAEQVQPMIDDCRKLGHADY